MKKILFASAIAMAVSSPALAQSAEDSADLSVTATVQPECSIGEPTAVTFAVNINEGAGANALFLQNGSQNDVQNIYVSCNYGTTIEAKSENDGLINEAGEVVAENDPDDFTNKIEYRVFLTSTDGSFPALDYRTRLEASDFVTAGGAFHDNASLRVEIDADDTNNQNKRPVAGTYLDTATITLGAV